MAGEVNNMTGEDITPSSITGYLPACRCCMLLTDKFYRDRDDERSSNCSGVIPIEVLWEEVGGEVGMREEAARDGGGGGEMSRGWAGVG